MLRKSAVAEIEGMTHAKKTGGRARDENLADDASSMFGDNAREEDPSSLNDDGAIGDASIAGPAKRDAESDVLDSGEPPAK